MRQPITALTCLVLLSACAATPPHTASQTTQPSRLNTAKAIYIAMPQDGVSGLDTYRGSGQLTAQIVRAAFERRAYTVKNATQSQPLDQALETAKRTKCSYLVYPTIVHWEDRATSWSGIPDRVEIKIDILDVASGEIQHSTTIKGTSGLRRLGNSQPQDLLPQPIEEFVLTLY